MDTFFTILKKTLVASMFVVFATAATYVPQPHTPHVYAGAAAGGSTVFQQFYDNIQQSFTGVATSASTGFDAIDSFSDGLAWAKEWLLDGLAWAIAKAIIGAMTQDLISWVNSGFEGAPMFLTDTSGFLRDIADDKAGEYIQSMGDLGSFICSPFQLDVQVAVALNYQKVGGKKKEACSLSDITGNLGEFINGTQRSFESGGWKNWIEISADPVKYTPYGATNVAVSGLQTALVNAKGEEIKLLDFGNGFMSQKKCEGVATPADAAAAAASAAATTSESIAEAKEKCTVTTPGDVISNSLSRGVDGDRETLLEADAANELFAAIVGQLGKSIFAEGASLLSGF